MKLYTTTTLGRTQKPTQHNQHTPKAPHTMKTDRVRSAEQGSGCDIGLVKTIQHNWHTLTYRQLQSNFADKNKTHKQERTSPTQKSSISIMNKHKQTNKHNRHKPTFAYTLTPINWFYKFVNSYVYGNIIIILQIFGFVFDMSMVKKTLKTVRTNR